MSFGGLYYPAYTPGFGSKPRLQTMHPFRNLLAAGSHLNNQWSAGSGHSDYGLDTPDYDYHSGPSAHVPSGGSYSYHATAGTGYGPPAAPAVHPPVKPVAHSPAGGAGKKGLFGGGGGKHGSSAMSALTLLSFLFFINLLQGCIKDHMDAMNPTVMVMTTNIIRNRFNKMGELNSREQSSSYTSHAANIVMQPHDLIQAAAAQTGSVMDATRPSVNLQTPYSNKPISFNRPLETAIPQPSAPYMPGNQEPDIPISYEYGKPHYDPHKPDVNEQITQQEHMLSYANQTTLTVAQAPPNKFTPVEQYYNFHHTEYNAQPAPPPAQPSANAPLYSTSPKPFYEHQHPPAVKPFNSDYGSQYGGAQQDYDFRQKYETTQEQYSYNPHFLQSPSTNNAHPWSTNVQTSSVVSGPYRRASVIAVSPKTKWIAVPAKIIDRSNFGMSVDDGEEHFEHHDDRDVFHSRLN